jgi:hypothetical protein
MLLISKSSVPNLTASHDPNLPLYHPTLTAIINVPKIEQCPMNGSVKLKGDDSDFRINATFAKDRIV